MFDHSVQLKYLEVLVFKGSRTTGTMDNWGHAFFDMGGQLGPSSFVGWTTGTILFFRGWTTGTMSF